MRLLIGLVLLCAAACSAQAQTDSIYQYQGADREAKLIEGAKKEGTLLFYTSMAPSESNRLAQAFEKKYGIKVQVWRNLSETVLQRAVAEARARRHSVDVIETNAPEVEVLAQEGLISEFFSPHVAGLHPHAVPPHKKYISDRVNLFVVAFNTQKVKREEIPQTYEGFADPKWKGRLGIEATDVEWMATLMKLGGPYGLAYFKQLASQRPDMRKGHVLFAELIASGEIPVGLTAYSANIESFRRRGAPVTWIPVEPVVARPQGLAVARNAPHPHAALLFVDFILSKEGQDLLASMGRTPVNTRSAGQDRKFSYTLVDPAVALDEADKWSKLWNELLIRR